MIGQLGFTLPLLIILALEAAVGVLLLCPKPLNSPAIALARTSHTQVGATVFHTLAGVLALLLASPLYDASQLWRTAHAPGEGQAAAALDTTEHEARTLLSFTLTASSLAMMFFLRKLGAALGALERAALSEAALLKQVKGLQSEYSRMAGAPAAAEQPSGAGAADALPPGEVGELRRLAADLEKMNSTLQARLDKSHKAHQLAESNLAALRTQARGLENEYDRLLAELDEAKRQLARAGLAAGGGDGGRFGKKDA